MREADSAAVELDDAGFDGRADVVRGALGNCALEQLEGRSGERRGCEQCLLRALSGRRARRARTSSRTPCGTGNGSSGSTS